LTSALRNIVLSMNYRHFMRSNLKINHMMVKAFVGETFDLVHCNDVDTLYAGSELRRSGTAKTLLYDSHEYWPGIGVHGSAPNTAIFNLEKRGIKHADFIITVNPLIADKIQKLYGLKTQPSVVMNCPHIYTGPLKVDTVHSPVRVLYQGKVQAFRGLDKLLLAFKYIDGAELTISGYGPLLERLQLLAASEELSDRVHFTGRYEQDDTFPIIAEYDIGVLPFSAVTLNLEYTSPNKFFDYAMGGLAVAASSLPFMRMMIEEHNMGRVFPRNDPESIAATLTDMISDTEKLKEYKKNARKTVEEHYYWEKQFVNNYPWKP
ncbi:MAG TPA: glycosyltransferase, partial [Anaerolineae bacterium]|nr:glycosyltransferase [Anaerolineae bacterium]